MRVVHESGRKGTGTGAGAEAGSEEGNRRTLADHVAVADSVVARARGLMFRRSVPEGYALVFPFRRAATRRLHMLCVPFDIDAVWTVENEVRAVERLSAWTGYGAAHADTVYELPAGAADGVAVGDRVRHVDGERTE